MTIGLATRGLLSPPSSGGIVYRMRGYDDSLIGYVFWTSAEVDGDGSDYSGPGPLSDIVVQAVLPPPA